MRLEPGTFFVACGLAESTPAVTNYGRTVLSVNKNILRSAARGSGYSEIAARDRLSVADGC